MSLSKTVNNQVTSAECLRFALMRKWAMNGKDALQVRFQNALFPRRISMRMKWDRGLTPVPFA